MILRHVYIKLSKESAGDRDFVVQESHRLLSRVPEVLSLTVEVPADETAEKAWDVALTLRFDTLEEVERYRAHADHKEYVASCLRPRLEVIKAWNFNVTSSSGSS